MENWESFSAASLEVVAPLELRSIPVQKNLPEPVMMMRKTLLSLARVESDFVRSAIIVVVKVLLCFGRMRVYLTFSIV